MELGRLGLSEHLRAAVERNPSLEIESIGEFDFDGDNNLISPFIPPEEALGAH
jgi:hypothetical protein